MMEGTISSESGFPEPLQMYHHFYDKKVAKMLGPKWAKHDFPATSPQRYVLPGILHSSKSLQRDL